MRLRPIVCLWFGSLCALAAGQSSIAAEPSAKTNSAPAVEAAVELVFTEGPAWHPDGSVYFTDIANDRIMRYAPGAETADVFLQPSGRANGLAFDAQGQLIACEGNERGGLGGRRIVRIDPATKKRTVICDKFEGGRFNSPNDLCLDRQGRIYFTDPYYGPDRHELELDVEGVYRVDGDGGNLVRILGADQVARPNGVALSADQKTLFVIDNHPQQPVRKVWAFSLNDDGQPTGKRRELYDFGGGRGGDGMCVDAQDNLYIASGANRLYPHENLDNPAGVLILSPAGKKLGFVPVPEDMVTNCCLGGPDGNKLYITAGKTLWKTPKPELPGANNKSKSK